MANPSDSTVQNLLPVQAFFDVQGNFQTFIGQNKPFYATANPQQSGLNITSSTINSTTIGSTTPSTGVFTNIATTTGTISTAPSGANDIANKQYVDFYAAGLSWKQPVLTATSANITRSGLQTINGVTVVAGDRVLVKDQSTASENGIYVASATAWTYAVGADDWNEYVGAIVFVSSGSLNGTAWYCTAQPGGTLGVTAMNWSNFSVASSYTAGTGLTLTGTQFSITNTGVSAATYGSASSVPVIAINAQGQATSVTNTNIAINGNQITSGTIGSSYLSGSYTGITGLGTLGDLTVTNAIVGSITGNAATATLATSATSATTATNLAGGASGNVPYQTASGATTFLATGSNGQVLTLASGVPSWATPTTGTVTSVSGSGTVSGISLSGTVTSSGSLTLGGTLDLSAPPAIGGTTPNSGAFTTVTASSSLTTPTVQATNSGGLALKNSAGTTQISMGGGGGDNVSINVSTNLNGSNAQIDISPTGTGHVHIKPTGTGALEIAPTNAGTMNNMVIGGTTPLAGTFTDLRFNNTLSLAGSTGTAGYVVTSNGASAPTWQALPASGITITDDTTTNATRYITFTSATSGSITGANVSSTKLAFNPSTGNFGIGTSSPPNKFTVWDGGTLPSAISNIQAIIGRTDGFANAGLAILANASNDTRLMFGTNSSPTLGGIEYGNNNNAMRFSTNSAERMRIDSAGNVGIGIASPTAKLHVYGGSNNQFKVESSGAEANLTLAGTSYGQMNNSVGDWYLTNDTANSMIFRTASSERMRIDGSGDVFINATGLDGRFRIYEGAFKWAQVINHGNAGQQFYINFRYNGTGIGGIDGNNSNVAYNTSSDYRLKENVTPMTGALDKVKQLKPVNWVWKIDGSDGQGFIAHELQEVVPDCVTGEKDAVDEEGKPKYQGVDTSFLVATLTAAIQELNAKLDAQAVEIATLKAK